MLPNNTCIGLWPGNCLITQSSWASITEGRIGPIVSSFRFWNLEWDLNTIGYSHGLIVKDLSNKTTHKSSSRLFPSAVSCSTAKIIQTLTPNFPLLPRISLPPSAFGHCNCYSLSFTLKTLVDHHIIATPALQVWSFLFWHIWWHTLLFITLL